jgi:aminoglycoside phosphotransferase (APT) family kinase protein
VGRRIGYAALPAFLHAWVDARYGPVTVLRDHVGGMSPGCATSLRTAAGETVFVKAVGAELNAQTVELFRAELRLQRILRPAPYRPALLDGLDRDGWVAIVLRHVDGRFPDLSDDTDLAAVAAAVDAQVAELTPAPAGVDVLPLAETARRWLARWADVAADPFRYLPGWAAARCDALLSRVRTLPDRLPPTTLCHFDVRDDNVLIRPDGSAVLLDWGMARLGPAWTDRVLLAAQRPTAAAADRLLRRWLDPADQDTVTDFLLAFAGSQAWNGAQPERPALPTFAAFCRADAGRLFALAQHRLGT